MKIALCQFNVAWNDKKANQQKILNLLRSAPDKTMDWLIFPEMTLSGFTMETQIAETTPEEVEWFANIAREYNTAVSFGAVQNGYNNLITINKFGKIINTYSKIHLYAFGGENKYYKAAEKQTHFELNGLRVTPAICFDLRFPYLFFNTAEQTDVYVVIASWPGRRAEHWTTLLRARAIENQAYCIGVNNTGVDTQKIEYTGNSMAFDPLGKTVVDAGTKEGLYISQIAVDKELVAKTRTRFPFLNEKKPGAVFA
jgi:predicted amidohydrolase